MHDRRRAKIVQYHKYKCTSFPLSYVFAVKGYQYSFEHSLHTFAVKVKIVYYIKDGTFRLASQFSKRD